MLRNRFAFATLVGGGIAGLCDLTYAISFSAYHGVAPLKIMQSVASGLLGADAFTGGVPVAVLGVVLHFLITFAAAALFYLASRRIRFLVDQAPIAGMLYGLGIYLVMTFVVLPLSAWPGKFSPNAVLIAFNLVIHIFFVGLPIALATRYAHRRL